jgi:hypothetical protein
MNSLGAIVTAGGPERLPGPRRSDTRMRWISQTLRSTKSRKRFALAGSAAMRLDTALPSPMSLDPSSRPQTRRDCLSPARRRVSEFTPRDAPLLIRPASACASGSGSARRYSTIRSRSRSCRWDSAFPGLTPRAAVPPRRECAETWRERLFDRLPNLELILLVGQYAQKWHLGATFVAGGLTETVGRWRDVYRSGDRPRLMPMPHPSWRNNAWLTRNPWFEFELLPALRVDVARIVAPGVTAIEPSPGASQKMNGALGTETLRRSTTGLP